jgi:hypothetical protein
MPDAVDVVTVTDAGVVAVAAAPATMLAIVYSFCSV